MQRIDTRLPGLVLLAPAVHGDARGFFMETYRADAWAAEGVPTEFLQDNHSRSRQGTLRGLHFQTHPGQGKLVRVARGRVLDVVVDLRRGSPTFGDGRGSSSTTSTATSSTSPSASATASACSPRPPTSSTSARTTTTRRPSPGIRFDDPDVGVAWPADVELLYSDRDRDAPRLVDVADTLPFTYDP